jgi:hypothetical protein
MIVFLRQNGLSRAWMTKTVQSVFVKVTIRTRFVHPILKLRMIKKPYAGSLHKGFPCRGVYSIVLGAIGPDLW